MLPSLSGAGRTLVLSVLLSGGLSLIARSEFGIMLATMGAVALAAAYMSALPLSRRLRRSRTEFAWWLEHGTGTARGAVVPDVPFEISCYLRHRGAFPIHILDAKPLLSEGLELLTPPELGDISPSSRTDFRFTLQASCSGRGTLHGLSLTLIGTAGLFETALYFPNPLSIRVLPRAAVAISSRSRILSHGLPATKAAKTRIRRRGGGTDLHELREFVPGDPFKSIAWKASARRGKLIIKEVEQELQHPRWVIIDSSGSMRDGRLGKQKLDIAIELAAAECQDAMLQDDRIGLLAFDRRVVSNVPMSDGVRQQTKLWDALLNLTECVDADLLDIPDERLLRWVLTYLRQQEGRAFESRGTLRRHELEAHLDRLLPDDRQRSLEEKLRLLCRDRSIRLPHQANVTDGAKERALLEALKVPLRSKDPTRILLCTDLEGIENFGTLVHSIELLQRRGHRVSLIVAGPRPAEDETNPSTIPARGSIAESLQTLSDRRLEASLMRARRELAKRRVPVVLCTDPREVVAALSRLDRRSRRAA